jgi:hypothetical protein
MNLINKLTNFVTGDLSAYLGDGIVADAVNGALFGAVTTAVGGGDIAKGAVWGAAGNAISGSDNIFGEWTNEIGGGIAGYGIDKAMGGSGILGAASGAVAERLNEGRISSSDNTADKSPSKSNNTELAGDSESTKGFMEKYGLENEKGEGTLLGRALVGGVGAYGQSLEAEKTREHLQELVEQGNRNTKELDEEFEQRDLRAFSSPLIVRNG